MINPNSLHNLDDGELFRELNRRYPDFVFAGMDLKGRVVSPFQGSMLSCLGMTVLLQQTITNFMKQKSEQQSSLLTS